MENFKDKEFKTSNPGAIEALKLQEALVNKYGQIYWTVLKILWKYDPEGINYNRPWEVVYRPEADTIVPRLAEEATSEEDLEKILFQEFNNWFYPGGAAAVNYETGVFKKIAGEIWSAWKG